MRPSVRPFPRFSVSREAGLRPACGWLAGRPAFGQPKAGLRPAEGWPLASRRLASGQPEVGLRPAEGRNCGDSELSEKKDFARVN